MARWRRNPIDERFRALEKAALAGEASPTEAAQYAIAVTRLFMEGQIDYDATREKLVALYRADFYEGLDEILNKLYLEIYLTRFIDIKRAYQEKKLSDEQFEEEVNSVRHALHLYQKSPSKETKEMDQIILDFRWARLQVGFILRKLSATGPCFRLGEVTRVTNQGVSFIENGRSRHLKKIQKNGLLHTQPCERCTDHPQTYYPRGYDN